ncbi:MAG TPA: M23 family metallopeptidase [Pyrinomonadaceae bacterium]|jgi:murein DD-endopeptidase MepM/ murein hydrolase activator NlpD
MVRDDRLYAFIVARTNSSRARIRQIRVHKRTLKLLTVLGLVALSAALYGFYGLTQQAIHLRIERENERLRAENERQRKQLNNLNQRIEAVEDNARRLVELSGASSENRTPENRGTGGPEVLLDSLPGLVAVEYKTDYLERELKSYEEVLKRRATVPSIWPVAGELSDGFGGRRNPFGGLGSEFHTGQDISAITGTPVMAAAQGTVIFAGWQNGYGQIVIIDHGNGLTTRYGHLSGIDVELGQQIARGQQLGRVGSTGRSTGPHLHYEVRINDEPVNPRQYLPLE